MLTLPFHPLLLAITGHLVLVNFWGVPFIGQSYQIEQEGLLAVLILAAHYLAPWAMLFALKDGTRAINTAGFVIAIIVTGIATIAFTQHSALLAIYLTIYFINRMQLKRAIT